jgi:multidrug transporter EmrE-like cation transporter
MKNTILILISVLLNCAAQIAMKKGMIGVGEVGSARIFVEAFPRMVLNVFLWASLFCYVISILLWMVVLSRVDVSFAYPFLSIGYIVSSIAGYFLFGENVSLNRIIGILIICVGVVLISRS